MKKYFFRKLTTRLMTTFALLAIPGALLVGYSSYYLSRGTIIESIYERLESIASIKEENLRWWIDELTSDVENLAGAGQLRQDLRTHLRAGSNPEEAVGPYERMTTNLEWFSRSDEDILEVFLLTWDEGRVFLSTEKAHEGDYRINDSYFIQGREGTYVQKVITSPVVLTPGIVISTPLLSLYGEKLGVLAARLNLDRMDEIFLERSGLGLSGESYLVDRYNNLVSSRRFDREKFRRGIHSPGIDDGIQGKDGRGLYANYAGVPVIGAYHWLEDLDLLLVTEIRQSEAFAPARRLGWSLFLLGMSIAFVVLLGSLVISRKIVRPILSVRDAAARVARGDFWVRAPVITGDEVGMLAASFNEMTGQLELLYNALQASEEHFRSVFRLSPDAISVIHMEDEVFADMNEGFANITGFSREDIVGHSTAQAGVWVDRETRDAFLRELRETGLIDKRQIRFRRKDGSSFIGSISARVVDIGGEPHRISVIRDVTQLRAAENELRRTNTILETQMETSLSGIMVADGSGRIISCNSRFVEMWGIPPDIEESGSDDRAIRFVLDKLVDPDGFVQKVNDLYASPDERSNDEVQLLDGRIFERHSAPMKDQEGNYYGRVWYFRDVTEARRSEARLVSSVREKEVLLQEIHHRVKNNLQVISGLLDLQSYHITDNRGKEIYKESQNRIITMALIHEELYQSRDLAQVDYGTYVKNLVNNLYKSYAVDPERIKLDLKAENARMVVDTAIPCGLIINELVSNALKHAFPNGREGCVTVVFRQEEEGPYHLEVADDGIGLPDGLDIRKSPSLGLQLITVLVQQLQGAMRVEPENGVRFTVEFEEYQEAGAKLF